MKQGFSKQGRLKPFKSRQGRVDRIEKQKTNEELATEKKKLNKKRKKAKSARKARRKSK